MHAGELGIIRQADTYQIVAGIDAGDLKRFAILDLESAHTRQQPIVFFIALGNAQTDQLSRLFEVEVVIAGRQSANLQETVLDAKF